MILGIDASNIRSGGGVTHMVELLRSINPEKCGFSRVIIWSNQITLQGIEDRPLWLVKSHQPLLNQGLASRIFWQIFKLSRLAHLAGCNVLFVPGGSYAGTFRPVVTMSQNLLPFEWREMKRFGFSWMSLKLMILRITQASSFYRADGVVFLTRYAYNTVMKAANTVFKNATIVPHGVNKRFVRPPRKQMDINSYSVERPLRLLYVSTVDVYKHQWQVAKAIGQLRQDGFPVSLDLVGPAYPRSLKKLTETLLRIDPKSEFIRYVGEVPYTELPSYYDRADMCIFGSSCENMPNILLEGMASGLPIACSNRGPMPEVLGDVGIFFDPESPEDIARALKELIESPELRSRVAQGSFKRSKGYSWNRCAEETFKFLANVASEAC